MEQYAKYVISLIFIASIFFINYSPQQQDFLLIFFGFTIAFVSFALLLSQRHLFKNRFQFLLVIGIIARLCLLPLLPNLSDDIYRFFWDGILSHNGINPYSILPAEALSGMQDPQMTTLFQSLNSQEYYTIYPPIAQLFFYIGSIAKSILGFSIVLKTIFICFDLLTVFFLVQLCSLFHLNRHNVFFYFLNPLVIVEGVGNLHFETLMLCFFAGALYFLAMNSIWKFVAAFVMAVSTKLIPLIFGPILFLKFLKGRRSYLALFIGIVLMIIVFLPLLFSFQFSNFAESLDLYFRKFEFNASIYYGMREIGYWLTGYNVIQTLGPSLALVSLGVILYISFKAKAQELKQVLHACIFIITFYLLTATTVHPWYLITLIFLGVFMPYKFILFWSYLIVLSYYAYSTIDFQENFVLISLEYVVVLFFLIKILRNKRQLEHELLEI